MPKREWPSWWAWELELSPHLQKRMIDRQFTEVDLRLMLEHASALHEDPRPGRWVAVARNDGATWEIILEPDSESRRLVVITAYRAE